MPTGITGLTNVGNGLAANDGTGDTLRTGAAAINANSAAIVTAINNLAASQSAGAVSYLIATFSIQGSRIVNFDRNLNRRLTQTVITAVLQMQFFAGDLR